MALLDMGVDALPARDAVHAALEQADDASVPPDQRDALRARALLADLAIESGMTRDLARTRTRELASVVIGKAITSPVLRMDDLGPPLSGGGTALFEQNTVVGVVATCAPTVFVLEDLAAHGDVPRDQLVRVLERLSEAPFHLVSKVDSGEFCLRYRVHDALDQLGTYAGSLRARLPERQRERVRGLPEGVEPIDMHDVPPTAGAPSQERQTVKVTAPRLPAPKQQAKVADKPKAKTKTPGKAGLRVVDDTAHDEPGLILDQGESRSSAPLFTGPGFGQAFGDDEESDYDLSGAVPRRKSSQKG